LSISLGNILNIRQKLIITLINILFIVSVSKGQYLILSLYLLTTTGVILIFSPGIKQLLRRVFIVFLYPFFISIFIPFLSKGNAVVKFDLKIFDLIITDNGITVFTTVLIKSFLSVLLMASLLLSSSEMELLDGLRKIRLPRIIVSIIFLMYRYVFLIIDESRIGQMAIKARVFKKRSYGAINKRITHLMGNLFIKSFNRAENIYKSMESRGFDGDFYIVENGNEEKIHGNMVLSIFIIIPVLLKAVELCNIL